MAERWIILAALTLARAAMGFQFQALPAIGADAATALALSDAALGFAIGLYLLPGALAAIPGGWLGRRFGDKQVLLVGLASMAFGGAGTALVETAGALFALRAISGAGAVLLNVLVTKMVADWFDAKALPTAMGVLITSWPAGIALALVVAPPLAEALDWRAPLWLSAAVALLCLGLVALIYRAPAAAPDAAAPTAVAPFTGRERLGALLAGGVWTFYNMAFILVPAFAPAALEARGADAVSAAAAVSLAGWLIIPALASGGWLVSRIRAPNALLLICLLAAAPLIWSAPGWTSAPLVFALVGLIFGPPGPLIMTYPARAVSAPHRSLGMGIYFTVYYVGMAAAPPVAGLLRDLTGSADAPLWFAGVCALIAAALALTFLRLFPAPDRA